MEMDKLKQKIEEYLDKDYCCEFKEECKAGVRTRCSEYEAKLYLILRFVEPLITNFEEELKIQKHNTHTVAHLNDCIRDLQDKHLAELEKENAELKAFKEKCRFNVSDICKEIETENNLTKAKKIIKTLLRLWNDVMTEETVKALVTEAEQFLKENE